MGGALANLMHDGAIVWTPAAQAQGLGSKPAHRPYVAPGAFVAFGMRRKILLPNTVQEVDDFLFCGGHGRIAHIDRFSITGMQIVDI